jgi:hypothetical protein
LESGGLAAVCGWLEGQNRQIDTRCRRAGSLSNRIANPNLEVTVGP